MRSRFFAIVITLLSEAIMMGSGGVYKQNAHRDVSEDCRSCLECSHDNGCVRCPDRLFLFLQRDGMSHHGICLHACPTGHYGQRGKDINRCMKCRSMFCEQCFSRDFCTKCKPGFQLYKGKCLLHCPGGTFTHQSDCFENCLLAPLGEWSEWSTCQRDSLTCGFRWGKQTRTRGPGHSVRRLEGSYCPSQSETQRCRMKKKCPSERRRTKKPGLGRKRERKRLRMLNSTTAGNYTSWTTTPAGGQDELLASAPGSEA
ncbi:R-spondin-4-like [Synchiropus splendidus]|uniref:R-spondin-4-like n=1 Tax=Synchiropus splendidus TaxID=270530 RepID=UPI00237D54F0|nr:R-spondin-4-like [Synchiropus splendidus]XP_053724786.1 R-spondin-4-like [Synchiropus splendidus]